MGKKDDFDFLNSRLWIDYTQKRYLTPDEIKYRLKKMELTEDKWVSLRKEIVATRKTGAITLFFKSITPRFWFYPSDNIHKKIHDIENLGKHLYEVITKNTSFKNDFFLDSTIEEAITSAIYEGAHSTRAQAEQLIASGRLPKNKDEWMLINNLKSLKWVENNQESDLTQSTLLQLHSIVTDNTLEGDDINFQGKFRDDKVFVGSHEGIAHGSIEAAIKEMIELVTNNPRYIHPLIRGILLHYFVGCIHPFFDGNGRTARAIFYFKSIRNNLKYIELLSISAYLLIHGKQYENSFIKVKENEYDITYFINFCLDAIWSALQEVERKVNYLLKFTDLKQQLNLSMNQIGLLQRMALHKFRTIDAVQYALQISKSKEYARQELKQLLDHELVTEVKISKKLVYKVNAEKLKRLYGSQ